MRFSEFAFLFVKSLNPGDYRMLITRKKRDTINYFLTLLFFAILIGFIFSVPKLMQVPDKIQTTLMKFERFNITGVDIEAKEKILLFNFPKIVLDLSGNETQVSDEFLLITKSDVYWKKFRPSLFEWKLFETKEKKVTEYGNVIQDFSKISGGTYWLIFMFFLPSLLLLTYLFDLLKYSVIIAVFTLAGYIISKIKGKKIKITGVWRAAVYSSTLMIITEITVFQLFRYSLIMAIIPLVIYFIMFLLAMLVLVEKDIQIKPHD
jgi:hypothetical protein